MYTSTFMQATIFGLIFDLVVIELATSFLAKTSSTKILSFIFAFAKSTKLPPNHLYLLCLFEDGEDRKERLARLEEEKLKKEKNKVAPKKDKSKKENKDDNGNDESQLGSEAGTQKFSTNELEESQMGMLDGDSWGNGADGNET